MSDQENRRTKTDVAVLLSEVMPTSQNEQEELARQVGYEKSNILSMFANGDMKVPIEKVPALAAALGIDAGRLMRLAVKQFLPASSLVAEILTENIVSENEMVLIKALRIACGNADPVFAPEQVEAAVCLLSGAAKGSTGDRQH